MIASAQRDEVGKTQLFVEINPHSRVLRGGRPVDICAKRSIVRRGLERHGRFRHTPGAMIHVTENIAIADWELTETFSRASGPGGQNVNQVASAVSLRFEAERSPNLPEPVKKRLKRLAGQRWTNDGAVVIRAEEHRSQVRNREAALQRLVELIKRAAERPKKRIATRPTLASKRRRMDAKTKRGAVKALRGRVDDD